MLTYLSPKMIQQPLSGEQVVSPNITMQGTFTPSVSATIGTMGTIKFDTNYLYVCVATNIWKRIPLSSW